MLAAAGIDELDAVAEQWLEIAEKEGSESQREQIDAILAELGIPTTDPVAVTWHELAGARRAHRSGFGVRPMDSSFEKFWADTKGLLDGILEKFEHRYLLYFDIIDTIVATAQPSANELKRLKESVPRNVATYRHFFEQITNPAWFAPLKKRGFFQDPFLGYWPQAVYLRKVAAALPSEVLAVMMSVATDSVWTHIEFATAASQIPPRVAAMWAENESSWVVLQQHVGWTLPERYALLIVYLAQGNELDGAYALLASLLSPAPTQHEREFLLEELPSRLEWYDTEQVMGKCVPALISVGPARAFSFFCDRLDSVLRETPRQVDFDQSHFWRPSIAQQRGMLRGRRDELVSAVRDSAEAAIQSNAIGVADVIAALDDRKPAVFARIAQFLLSRFPDQMGERIAADLQDLDLLVGSAIDERRELLRRGFRYLLDARKAEVIDAIERGPNLDDFKERVQAWRGTPATDQEIRSYALRWQTDLGELIVDTAGTAFAESHARRRTELDAIATAAAARAIQLKSQQNFAISGRMLWSPTFSII